MCPQIPSSFHCNVPWHATKIYGPDEACSAGHSYLSIIEVRPYTLPIITKAIANLAIFEC